MTRNWGDAFNTELATNVFGRPPIIADLEAVYPRHSAEEHTRHAWFLIGSVLHRARSDATVWGSGLMRYSHLTDLPQVHAVRGRLTANALHDSGLDYPLPLGDPALLIRYMDVASRHSVAPQHHIGIIPHYIHRRHHSVEDLSHRLGARILDIRSPTPTLVRAVSASTLIASSSLHGLILAHALGVPHVWIHFDGLPPGGTFKYHDFYSTLSGMPQAYPGPMPANLCTPQTLAQAAIRPRPIDLRPMLEAFPHDSDFLARCHAMNAAELGDAEWPRLPIATPLSQ